MHWKGIASSKTDDIKKDTRARLKTSYVDFSSRITYRDIASRKTETLIHSFPHVDNGIFECLPHDI